MVVTSMNEKNLSDVSFCIEYFFLFIMPVLFSQKVDKVDKEGGKNDERKGVNKDNFYFHFLHQKN